ncbi:MAG: NRDE family protein [Alphaproteobacteria bacterium]
MCTLILLRRPGHDWPLIVGANRDEARDRPWRPPAAHWPDRPGVIGGLDLEAGGSWLVLSPSGIVAAVLNGPLSRGPAAGYRSRGELVLEAADGVSATQSAEALADLNGAAFRPFSLVVADDAAAWLVRNFRASHDNGQPQEQVDVTRLADGLTMLTTSGIPNDMSHPRIRDYLPRFSSLVAPDPQAGGEGSWSGWETLMGSRHSADGAGPRGAMSLAGPGDHGTVSSSIIAVPAARTSGGGSRPVWRFAAGPPHQTAYATVGLAGHLPPDR